MLERKIYKNLLEWKKDKRNSCLLVKGARQIGKTFIIEYFGKQNYKSYIYINFVESPKLKDIFRDSLSVNSVCNLMTLIFPDIRFIEHDTLIFFDEIQECPEARASLKFFAIDGRYDVVASGSLLGISYKETSSIPVGYETQIKMHSLDFEEYLWANKYSEETIKNLKSYFEKQEKIPNVIHEEMLKKIREYIVVGGMPAVINEYIKNKHFGNVHKEQQKIIDSYFDDISKYASVSEKPKVKNCYLSITRQLAKENKKFQFSLLEKKSSARKFENSIEWLRDASLINLSYNVTKPQYPLSVYVKEDQYKLYISDIGLLISMYGFDMKKQIIDDTLLGGTKGGIYENLIANMLCKNGFELCYFRKKDSSLEIEFLISIDDKIVPIEVKANHGSTKSLNKIVEDSEIPFGYKFSSQNIGVSDKKVTMPFYMAMFLTIKKDD